ncbi:MAG: MaoC family dehydratase [Arenicellales bacterium]
MKTRYAEDYKAGDVFELGTYELSQKEIIEFSQKYDPFPFHVDEQAAKNTVFNGIISSGWLTGLVWLRMMHDSFLCHETTLGSPGHEKILWPKPVRPGDHLTGLLEIKESKVSVSKPDLGFVRYTSTLKNQNQEDVFITTSTMIVKPRPVKTQ